MEFTSVSTTDSNHGTLAINDRAEVTFGRGTLTGFIARSDEGEITMVLDDGRRQVKGAAHLFRRSDRAVPDTSPFALPLSPGRRVEFDLDGTVAQGTVLEAGVTVRVRRDGAREDVILPRSEVRASATALPSDEPTIMDRWSVGAIARNHPPSQEGFTATILRDGQPVLRARSDGRGGAFDFYPLVAAKRDEASALQEDARAWAAHFGANEIAEPGATWLAWAVDLKPYGVSARDYLEELQQEVRQLSLS